MPQISQQSGLQIFCFSSGNVDLDMRDMKLLFIVECQLFIKNWKIFAFQTRQLCVPIDHFIKLCLRAVIRN